MTRALCDWDILQDAARPLSGMTVIARNSCAEPHIHQQGPLDPVRGKPLLPSCHTQRQPWTALQDAAQTEYKNC